MDFLKSCACLLVIALLPYSASAGSAELRLQEQQIKAGLLYNFLKYTQWPESSFAQVSFLTVCIFGDDPFGGNLKPIAGKTVNQREIALRQLRTTEEVSGCHLLFVNAEEKTRWPGLRELLAGKNVLTVSDFDNFTDLGGMIEFGRTDNHISASLNINATAAAGLRVENRLLKLVTVVHGQ